jgi:uncharacterized protein YegL
VIVIAQTPFDAATFAENPEPRCPCVLLLDTSGSMSGDPIQQLNEGVQTFREELTADELAARRVEAAIVAFGPVRTEADFTTPDFFYPQPLEAGGDTPMGEAILHAIGLVDERKKLYKSHGVAYFRPWIFLITDGGPTDSYAAAAQAVRDGEAARRFNFFAVGVEGANFKMLAKIASPERPPLKLQGLKFRELFRWLSSSLKGVSHSQAHSGANPDERLALPAPTDWARGWQSV